MQKRLSQQDWWLGDFGAPLCHAYLAVINIQAMKQVRFNDVLSKY